MEGKIGFTCSRIANLPSLPMLNCICYWFLAFPCVNFHTALSHTFMATSAISTSQTLWSVLGGRSYKINLVQPQQLFAVSVFSLADTSAFWYCAPLLCQKTCTEEGKLQVQSALSIGVHPSRCNAFDFLTRVASVVSGGCSSRQSCGSLTSSLCSPRAG